MQENDYENYEFEGLKLGIKAGSEHMKHLLDSRIRIPPILSCPVSVFIITACRQNCKNTYIPKNLLLLLSLNFAAEETYIGNIVVWNF